MSKVWVNGKFFTSDNPKLKKLKRPAPISEPERILYSTCVCGESIYEDDWVGMKGDHEYVVCLSCWHKGVLPIGHVDVCGLKFPELTLSN